MSESIGKEIKIGDRMLDGTVYSGISPDTGETMYTTPCDAPLSYTFNQAQEYASKLDAHGYRDWRVPTKNELSALFHDRAAIGGFDKAASSAAGWYWSSTQTLNLKAWDRRFSYGPHNLDYKMYASFLRCVRG